MHTKKRISIASHRGCFAGNIVENTLSAFEIALNCGADIIEMDIRRTKDDVFVVFHDENVHRLLGLPGIISDYTLSELRKYKLFNAIGNRSNSHINTLEQALSALKGRCLINLDQCWFHIDKVYDIVASLGMQEQVLIKSRAPYNAAISWVESKKWKPTFVPIITCEKELDQFFALPQKLEITIVQVFLDNEKSELISADFVQELHNRGIRLWVNALDLGNEINLAAGHDDTVSVCISPQKGWGWLIQHGVDIIQTDWPDKLRCFLEVKFQQ